MTPLLTRLEAFVAESNHIEGILRPPTNEEVAALEEFLARPGIKTPDLQQLVSVFQPDAVLRDRDGLDVRVGDHIAPSGGPRIPEMLDRLLMAIWTGNIEPWQAHVEYETLHPFTDGNGRSGRALWLWQMRDAPLGFLHTFYYQTLSNSR